MKNSILHCLLLLFCFTTAQEPLEIKPPPENTTEIPTKIVDTNPAPTIYEPPSYNTQSIYKHPDQVPNPKKNGGSGYISDPNDYLSIDEELRINQTLWDIENTTTAQVAVVVLESIGDEIPKNFAVELFELWGIGHAKTDNGLLILTVMDQRRTEFEVGYGLEHILTDAVCYRIGVEEIVPEFKEGDYGEGLLLASTRIGQFLKNPKFIDQIYTDDIVVPKEPSKISIFIKNNLWLSLFLLFILINLINLIINYVLIQLVDQAPLSYYEKYLILEKSNYILKYNLWIMIPLFLSIGLIRRIKAPRLKKYRNAPRFSRENGKEMFLLSSIKERRLLKKEQNLEEKLDSVSYDVWQTKDKSDTLILRYDNYESQYRVCPKCDYKAFGLYKSVIKKRATYSESGSKQLTYRCQNCKFQDYVLEKIPRLESEFSSSSNSNSSSSSSSSYSSSSSSSNSSSSTSYGGGSSGGGGAGVSW